MTHKPEKTAGNTCQVGRAVDGGLTPQRQTLVSENICKRGDGSMSDFGFDGFDGFDGFSLEGYVRAGAREAQIFCPPPERTRQIRQTAIDRFGVWRFPFDVAASTGRQPAVKGVA